MEMAGYFLLRLLNGTMVLIRERVNKGLFNIRRFYLFTSKALFSCFSIYVGLSAVSRILENVEKNNENNITIWVFLRKIQQRSLPLPDAFLGTHSGSEMALPSSWTHF